MERNIGEIFEYNGEWYQCLGQYTGCPECAFKGKSCDDIINFRGECISYYRSDRKDVHFKKLEKVGEPYAYNGIVVQKYKLETNQITIPGNLHIYFNGIENTIEIEIKQEEEDMEGKKIQHYDCFFDGKSSKSNLKPFDLKAAKAGKPVCTRDGRKARIVCFDAEGNKPLIVLSKINGQEVILRYTEKGRSDNFHSPTPREDDLMMLPEKKEGWINIYNADTTFYYVDGRVFETKDEAVQEAKEEVEKGQREKNEYIETIRVEWEE